MGRPREFDERAVLEAAIETFWVKGYEGTSTRDLTASTGLTPSSMYSAFSDKRTLFRRALDRYVHRLREKFSRFETYASPSLAISTFFDEAIERAINDKQQLGCMLVNSALEASPSDPEFRKAIAQELLLIQDFFCRCFIAGQKAGEISTIHSADEAANLLFSILVGLRVLARVRPERNLLAGAVRPALIMLGLPALPSESRKS